MPAAQLSSGSARDSDDRRQMSKLSRNSERPNVERIPLLHAAQAVPFIRFMDWLPEAVELQTLERHQPSVEEAMARNNVVYGSPVTSLDIPLALRRCHTAGSRFRRYAHRNRLRTRLLRSGPFHPAFRRWSGVSPTEYRREAMTQHRLNGVGTAA